eukprot:7675798-Pyramimonas_sp.AAC.1
MQQTNAHKASASVSVRTSVALLQFEFNTEKGQHLSRFCASALSLSYSPSYVRKSSQDDSNDANSFGDLDRVLDATDERA